MELSQIYKLYKTQSEIDLILDTLDSSKNIFSVESAELKKMSEVINILSEEQTIIGYLNKILLVDINESVDTFVLSSVLNKVSDGVIVLNQFGKIIFVNKAYTDILNVPAYRVIGRMIEDVEPTAEIISVLTTGEGIINKETYIKNLNKNVIIDGYPLLSDGEIVGAFSIFKDVTETRILDRKVQRISAAAKEFKDEVTHKKVIKTKNIIGANEQFKRVLNQCMLVAEADIPILITGESGVGKEPIMDLIHQSSNRKNKPLIKVNCAAIPESLIESELFGYEPGAFTGAKEKGHIGKFEAADGGTLFLDEIGELPLSMQSKLLRVIQEGEIERVGSTCSMPVDVRLITATNRNLAEEVTNNNFRQDLFYRINVVNIKIPPLRHRKEDIPLLINYYLKIYNQKYQKNLSIDSECYSYLLNYSWPGNIRELKNMIEGGVIMCEDKAINFSHLNLLEQVITPTTYNNKSHHLTLKEAVEQCEKEMIQNILDQTNNDRQEAIKLLNISERTFYRKLNDYNIKI